MWPRSFWEKLYEPAIRRMAGLGDAPSEVDPDHYAAGHAHCELLIIGAGPAGIDAALEASGTNKRVILIDEQDEAGRRRAWPIRHSMALAGAQQEGAERGGPEYHGPDADDGVRLFSR
jgi:NADPH-dependent 2,4-dienoyl-CoA reductase/sulfur reductase-like enzyme